MIDNDKCSRAWMEKDYSGLYGVPQYQQPNKTIEERKEEEKKRDEERKRTMMKL